LNGSGQAAGSYYGPDGRNVGFIATPTAVPEPGAIILLAIGLPAGFAILAAGLTGEGR
jgi:hypothetical protein